MERFVEDSGAGTEDTQIGGEISKKKVHEKFLMNLKTTVA